MRSKSTRSAPPRKIRAVRRTSIIGASAAKPHMDDTSGIFHIYIYILGECRALWGERSEAWYRVTVAADAEAATYVKRVYVDYLYIVCAIMKIDYHLPLRAPMLA